MASGEQPAMRPQKQTFFLTRATRFLAEARDGRRACALLLLGARLGVSSRTPLALGLHRAERAVPEHLPRQVDGLLEGAAERRDLLRAQVAVVPDLLVQPPLDRGAEACGAVEGVGGTQQRGDGVR